MADPADPKPSIAYVDEHPNARDDFLTDAHHSGLFSEIHVLPPEPTLDAMVVTILDLSVDALVSDFRLSEAAPVPYDGENLVEAVLARRASFPCFIQTAFDDAALHETEDVNRVYSKNPKSDTGSREQFLQRIILQIQRHRARLMEWEEELAELLEIERGELTALQIERIIALDEMIEANLGADASLARQSKRELLANAGLLQRQGELIDETEKLLADMRKVLDE